MWQSVKAFYFKDKISEILFNAYYANDSVATVEPFIKTLRERRIKYAVY